ncbi:MAG: DNA-formamidopyrimidine glycosylase family protein, partial [Planctomycetota bacterium]
MPEGHTIHRVARDHGKLFAGERLAVSSPQGRFADGAAELDGRRLAEVEAIGKHLFYRWEGSPKRRGKRAGDATDVLHVHLGLYGKFRLHKSRDESGDWPKPRGAVRVRMVGADAAFDLNGPNRCELLDAEGYRRHAERLGPDPLRKDAD